MAIGLDNGWEKMRMMIIIGHLYELKQFDRFDYGANDDTDEMDFPTREYQRGKSQPD